MPESHARIDPRGQRFAAAVTTVVLAASLAAAEVAPTVSVVLLVVQALAFAGAVMLGPARGPYGVLYRSLVLPRIGKPAETEDARPPRFAQGVGLVFALVALVGVVTGLTALTLVATAAALVAAVLNATIGFCLGCEVYLLARRIAPVRPHTTRPSGPLGRREKEGTL